MSFFNRFISCLVLVVVTTLVGTSAYAQTPDLRIIPEAQDGLWETSLWPGGPGPKTTFAGSPDEACRLQHQSFNPKATYQGPVYLSSSVRLCTWLRFIDGGPPDSSLVVGSIVWLNCPPGHYRADGLCLMEQSQLPICNADCGSNPLSGTPQVNRANPININSGLKVMAETDYETADGLFTVDRQYVSSVGAGWQLLLPGYLEIGEQFTNVVMFNSRSGGHDHFISADLRDPNNWDFVLPNFQGTSLSVSRRRLSMVTKPTTDRETFKNDTNVSPTGPAEMRLDMANGEYILFRRANGAQTHEGWRRLVPVEHGKPGGYKIYYDYKDAGYNPYRVRDSLNRQMLLTWIDAPAPLSRPGFGGGKVISQIQLPDSTRLEYTYDDAATRHSGPIPTWAVQLGLNVGGVTAGKMNFGTDGPRERMRSVTRRSATGTLLWRHQFDYGYKHNAYAMTAIRDQNNATLFSYSYTGGGLLTSSKRAGDVNAHVFQHYEVYADNARTNQTVRRVLGPLGRTDDYWLFRKGTSDSEAVTISGIVGAATPTTPADSQRFEYYGSFIWGQNQMLTKSVDQLGRETVYTVDDANRRPTDITEASGTTDARKTTLQYHPVWDLPTRVERDGVRVDTTYTANAMVASVTVTDLTTHTLPYPTNGQKRTTTYTWGPNARLLSVNGPRSVDAQGRDDSVTFAYDASGNVTSMTNGLAQVTRFGSYDANGRPGTMTDLNGIITQFSYDLLGRVTSVRAKHPTTASLDAVTSFTYDIEGRVKSVTAPASSALTMTYNLAGLLKSAVASNGERIDYSHDAMGNVTSQVTKRSTGSTANSISQTFDALGRMLTETLGPGRTWTYAYDKVGNVTKATSPRNQSTAMGFDALDRLVASTLPDGGAPTLAYDARDGVTTSGDPIGVKTTFVRNGFGEAIQEVSPDRGTSTFYYSPAGDKTAVIDGRGQRINYSYDIIGRLLTAVPVGRPAEETVTYTWDATDIAGTYPKGRLSRIVDSGTTVEYGYDHRGNVTTKRQRIGTEAWATLSFTYDLADRRTQITYPSGRIVNYTFNTLGQVTQVRTKASAATAAWTTLASAMTYEAFGPMTAATYGNGTRLVQSWGNDNRLASRKLERTATAVALSALTYSYDTSDNITAITDGVVTAKSNRYAYDPVDRLTQKISLQGTFLREDYIHDDNGNRLSVERRRTETAATPAETDRYLIGGGTNRLTRIVTAAGTRTFTYDARGNQTGERAPDGSSVGVTYDGHARLIRYSAGTASQAMLYNGADERIRVITTPAVGLVDTRLYLYDLDHRIVGEYGPTGAADIKAEYIWTLPEVGASGPTGGDDGAGGYMPLATAVGRTGTLNWVHGHHLGTPILTTNAAGQAITPTGTAILGFPGQFANALLLSGAQHYYNRYRDYNFATGRYIQADPIGLAGDDNPYAYAAGNPLRYTDPSGEWAVIGAAIGAAGNLTFQLWRNGGRLKCVDPWEVANWALIGSGIGGIARGGAGLAFRAEFGRWGARGTWTNMRAYKVPHFHLGTAPGLGAHHLPYQAINWAKNLRNLMGNGKLGNDGASFARAGWGIARTAGGAVAEGARTLGAEK